MADMLTCMLISPYFSKGIAECNVCNDILPIINDYYKILHKLHKHQMFDILIIKRSTPQHTYLVLSLWHAAMRHYLFFSTQFFKSSLALRFRHIWPTFPMHKSTLSLFKTLYLFVCVFYIILIDLSPRSSANNSWLPTAQSI